MQSNYIIAIFRWSGKLVEIWGRSSWACVVRGNVTAVYIDLIQTIQYIKWKAKTYKHEVWTYQQPCSKGIRLWEGQFSWVLLLASVKSTGKTLLMFWSMSHMYHFIHPCSWMLIASESEQRWWFGVAASRHAVLFPLIMLCFGWMFPSRQDYNLP